MRPRPTRECSPRPIGNLCLRPRFVGSGAQQPPMTTPCASAATAAAVLAVALAAGGAALAEEEAEEAGHARGSADGAVAAAAATPTLLIARRDGTPLPPPWAWLLHACGLPAGAHRWLATARLRRHAAAGDDAASSVSDPGANVHGAKA